MVEIVLTSEQIRSAPQEVKDWIRSLLDRELAFAHKPAFETADARVGVPSLSACSREEAAMLLQQIREDYLACQVLFELGRDDFAGPRQGELHRVGLGEIMRHIRLQDSRHLAECFAGIGAAFRRVRGDPEAELFAFDGAGNCYIHETTHQSVKALWHALVAAQLPADRSEQLQRPPMPSGPSVPLSARPAGWDGHSADAPPFGEAGAR